MFRTTPFTPYSAGAWGSDITSGYGGEAAGAHHEGIEAENAVNGTVRGTEKVVSATPHADGTVDAVVEVPYAYPDGKIVTTTLTIVKNDVLKSEDKITRRARPSEDRAVVLRASWAAIASFALACGSQPSTPTREVSNRMTDKTFEIRNSDLAWDGTPIGLQPRIANSSTAKLVDAPATIDRELVESLRDPDRFATAHVLLTIRRHALNTFDASQWNGLRVSLSASGSARYEQDDMATLYERWNAVVGRTSD